VRSCCATALLLSASARGVPDLHRPTIAREGLRSHPQACGYIAARDGLRHDALEGWSRHRRGIGDERIRQAGRRGKLNSYPRTVRTGHFAWHTTVLAMVHGKCADVRAPIPEALCTPSTMRSA